jgi:hypothetical protein
LSSQGRRTKGHYVLRRTWMHTVISRQKWKSRFALTHFERSIPDRNSRMDESGCSLLIPSLQVHSASCPCSYYLGVLLPVCCIFNPDVSKWDWVNDRNIPVISSQDSINEEVEVPKRLRVPKQINKGNEKERTYCL